MTVQRMDNVGIVVDDIDAAIEFFTELGLDLEGRAPVEGDWADGVTGLRHARRNSHRTRPTTRAANLPRDPIGQNR